MKKQSELEKIKDIIELGMTLSLVGGVDEKGRLVRLTEEEAFDNQVDALAHVIIEWHTKQVTSRLKKIEKAIHKMVFDLYQSHDCENDTACEFEDRLGDILLSKLEEVFSKERKV